MARIVPSDLTRLALSGAHEPEIGTLALLREKLPDDYTVFHGGALDSPVQATHPLWRDRLRGHEPGRTCIEQKNGRLDEAQGQLFKGYRHSRKSVGDQTRVFTGFYRIAYPASILTRPRSVRHRKSSEPESAWKEPPRSSDTTGVSDVQLAGKRPGTVKDDRRWARLGGRRAVDPTVAASSRGPRCLVGGLTPAGVPASAYAKDGPPFCH
jgi:hypothetical protein